MLFPLIVTLALSFATPAFANHWGDGSSDESSSRFSRSYDSPSSDNSGFSAMQDQWRREAAQAEQRNQDRAREMNRPPTYAEPSWTNPNAPFGVFAPDGSYAVCQKGGSTVYCF